MTIKEHLCGVAIAYDLMRNPNKDTSERIRDTSQGSLYSYQKRAIADAAFWMWKYSNMPARFFTLTSPGYTFAANEKGLIKSFCHNIRNGYGCTDYVWVREYTKKGYPHFHFIANMPDFCPVKLSQYWSGLFGSQAKNSLRMGTYWGGRRCYRITNERQVWYLAKYIGKDFGVTADLGEAGFPQTNYRKTVRQFAISQNARRQSQPTLYDEHVDELYTGRHYRYFESEIVDPETGEISLARLPTKRYSWQWTGHGNTYIGFKKKLKSTEISQCFAVSPGVP